MAHLNERNVLWGAAALLGIAATAAIAWAASQLARQPVGLSSNPISVANRLAPASPGGLHPTVVAHFPNIAHQHDRTRSVRSVSPPSRTLPTLPASAVASVPAMAPVSSGSSASSPGSSSSAASTGSVGSTGSAGSSSTGSSAATPARSSGPLSSSYTSSGHLSQTSSHHDDGRSAGGGSHPDD